jgi:stress response protein YsnF
MSGGSPPIHGVLGDLEDTGGGARVLPLHKEEVAVSKRVRKTLIRATRTTSTRDTVVEEELHHDQVVVERVAIGRVVDAVPPIRQEGDVTILSVVEEVVVVERRLVLKEEVHLRRVQTTERHVETVTLREQDITVTRTDIDA